MTAPAPVPFLRERVLALGTLSALAPVPLFFTYALEIGLLAVYLLILGLLLLRVRRGDVPRLSNAVLNVAGLLYLPVYFLDARYGSQSLLRATLHLLLFTTVFKLASIRRERDLSVALTLCSFLFVASVSTSFHVSILLFVAAFALVAWPVLVRWSLWRDLAAAPEEWQRDPRARELPGRGSVAASIAAALVLAVPFFILLPRLRAPYVRGVAAGREITTGISDTADPDLYGELKRSDRVVARITAGRPLSEAESSLLRLRVVAFTTWDGRVWRNPERRARLLPAGAGTLVSLLSRRAPIVDEDRALEIDLLPLGARYVPYPLFGTALRFPEATFRGWAQAQVERDEARNVRLLFEPDRILRYVAYYGESVEPDRAPGVLSETARPEGSATLQRIARERTAGLDAARDPEGAARALEGWLRSDFTYALEVPPPGPRAVETFLLSTRRGHCQTFATAMALLLRELGVPTRFVSGFAGGEIGTLGRYILVRGEHAHAWVEAWCGERGWVAFDPTPVAGVPVVTRTPLMKRLRQLTDGVEFFFDRFILGFSQGDQVELIRSVREAAETAAESARDLFSRFRRLLAALHGRGGAAGRFALPLVALLLGLGVFALLRTRLGAFRTHGLPPASAAYRRVQKALARRGALLTPAAAPAETLEAAARFGPEARGAASEIVRAYARESFGGAPADVSEIERLREILAAFRRSLRAR